MLIDVLSVALTRQNHDHARRQCRRIHLTAGLLPVARHIPQGAFVTFSKLVD